jgi:protein-serine/threonine kinase
MRDSKSVDLERNDDIIHASATSALNGSTTPGMLTPLELTQEGTSPDASMSAWRTRSGSVPPPVGGAGAQKVKEEEEVNPFGEFSSVTRDIGDGDF